jgi:site-specific DNA recombinase
MAWSSPKVRGVRAGVHQAACRATTRLASYTRHAIGKVSACERIEAAVIDQLRGIFRRPEIIVGTWRAARAGQDDVTEAEVREALLQLAPLWDELFPAEQARIVQLLVERVDLRMHGVEVRLRPNGLAGLVREVAGGRRAAA